MIRKGCENCRRRHVKCTINEDASVCVKCAEFGRECELGPRFRFHNVRYIYQKDGNSREKYEFSWDCRQTWVNVLSPVHFVAERFEDSPEWRLSSSDDDGKPMPLVAENNPIATQESPFGDILSASSTFITGDHHDVRQECPDRLASEEPQHDHSLFGVPHSTTQLPSDPFMSHTLQHHYLTTSPVYQESSSHHAEQSSPATGISAEQPTASISSREAFLIRSYTRKLAPWLDVCDSVCHFANEVPRRALDNPMVMNAVLTVASRHQSIMTGCDEVEGNMYHGRCLELLIAALSRPEDTYDDNLLVTIVLLRLYEELDNRRDGKYHLLGSSRLLNTMSKFSSSGGLAEATSWLFLRQAIYVCLVQKEPWQLHLENYEQSQAFQCPDDASYANVMVYLFAKVLQLISQSQGDALKWREWESLEESVIKWKNSQPSSFVPLKYKDSDTENAQPFPELWMISAPTAVGTQYYHAAMILFKIHKPEPVGISAFECAKMRRTAEVLAAKHLVHIIGLAISNDTIENANFTASHLICGYGYCLSSAIQRQGVVSFLRHVEETMGWRVPWIIEELARQWKELDNVEDGLRDSSFLSEFTTRN